jgi:nucleotide-binding universal stress UspA family protein
MTVLEFAKTAPVASQTKPSSALSIKNILFPTDFSPISESALPYAVAIARRFGSTLHLVHVLSETNLLMMSGGVDYVSMGTIYDDAHAEAKEKLEKIAERIDGVPHRIYARHGLIWKSLAGIIAENEVDLIVVGTHGRTGLGKLLLGSVAEGILRHAPCPVLTVGPNVSGRAKLPELSVRDLAPPEIDVRQILFATNFGKNAALAAGDAVSLAQEFRARLSLLHVIEDYTRLGSNPGPIDDNLNRLRELIPRNAQLQYIPEMLIEFGNAPERLLKAAAERVADMIILGAHSSSEVGGTHLPWSAAHHVIAQAHCPVLTIRQ